MSHGFSFLLYNQILNDIMASINNIFSSITYEINLSKQKTNIMSYFLVLSNSIEYQLECARIIDLRKDLSMDLAK